MQNFSGQMFTAAPNFIHRKVADADVLISIGENIANFNGYIELNPSAVLIWDALTAPKSFEALREMLEKTYEITPEQAEEDLSEFLNLLLEHKMVTVQ